MCRNKEHLDLGRGEVVHEAEAVFRRRLFGLVQHLVKVNRFKRAVGVGACRQQLLVHRLQALLGIGLAGRVFVGRKENLAAVELVEGHRLAKQGRLVQRAIRAVPRVGLDAGVIELRINVQTCDVPIHAVLAQPCQPSPVTAHLGNDDLLALGVDSPFSATDGGRQGRHAGLARIGERAAACAVAQDFPVDPLLVLDFVVDLKDIHDVVHLGHLIEGQVVSILLNRRQVLVARTVPLGRVVNDHLHPATGGPNLDDLVTQLVGVHPRKEIHPGLLDAPRGHDGGDLPIGGGVRTTGVQVHANFKSLGLRCQESRG